MCLCAVGAWLRFVEVMKMLSVCGPVCLDKRQFHAKTMVSTRINLKLLLLNEERKKERKNNKMILSLRILLHLAVFCKAFWQLYKSC